MKYRITNIIIYAAIHLTSATAWAQHAVGSVETPKEAAQQHFMQAKQLYADQQYAEAADAFQQAYRLKPAWKLQFNIGQANSAAKRYGLALMAFENYMAEGGDSIPKERQEEVLSEIRRLRSLVGTLEISGPAGALVVLDGCERGTLPLEGALKVTAGKSHQLKVLLEGQSLLERRIRLSGEDYKNIKVEPPAPKQEAVAVAAPEPGKDQIVQVEITKHPVPEVSEEPAEEPAPIAEAVQPAPSEQKPHQDNTSTELKTGGVILLVTGITLGATGSVTGVLAMKSSENLEDDCSPDKTCFTQDSVNDLNRSTNLGIATNILMASGASLAVAGLVMLIAGKNRHHESVTAVRVSPVSTVGYNGIALTGEF